jgi:hypothetical protein
MPDKIGKPIQKTPEEKAADKKLLEDIENDKADPSPDFDPLEVQAEALPDSIKGSDGDKPHVLDAGDDGEPAHEVGLKDEEDEELGGGIGDASQLTAD